MTTSSSPSPGRPPRRTTAFTLTEMMVTVVLLALVLGSIVPTFAFFSRNVSSLGNYSIMSGESRGALERFGRDFRVAEELILAQTDEVRLRLPTDMDGATVVYRYDPGSAELIRSETVGGTTTSDVLFEDISSFRFLYYNRLGVDVSGQASILAETKSVQVDAKLVKTVVLTQTSDYIISARFLMRNFN